MTGLLQAHVALLFLGVAACIGSVGGVGGYDMNLLIQAAADKGWFPPSLPVQQEELEPLSLSLRHLASQEHEGPLSLRRLSSQDQKDPVFVLPPYQLAFDAPQPQGDAAAAAVALGAMEGAEQRRRGPRADKRLACRHTRGRWCMSYPTNPEEEAKPPPRGNKQCRNNCSRVGNCNYDNGMCDCPAGFQGDDCSQPLKRPCTHRGRVEDTDDPNVVMGHIDEDGRDLNWHEGGWAASRCTGICDDKLAMCWCDGKHKRIPPPKGSPLDTPLVQRGRPLNEHCGKVKTDKEGRDIGWGNVPYNHIYGPDGWCEADNPKHHCGCQLDGMHGHLCQLAHEQTCPNQCSGHGTCDLGFCKCHPGWYGLDCARKQAGLPVEASDVEAGHKPWLKNQGLGKESPAAAAANPSAPPQQARLPRIYVYDVPPAYTTRMLQYRLYKDACSWRTFTDQNETHFIGAWVYSAESYLHEVLLQSPHRTFDPDEADFFYVPVYMTCYFWPLMGWADYPWWYAAQAIRPMHGANMLMEVKRWLEKAFPYWNRRQGRDHIWLTTADEGPCWLPTEIYQNSIILSHWGRLDPDHTSNSAYEADNYTKPFVKPPYQKTDWRELYLGHPCYTPGKDLIIPSFKPPGHYSKSPQLGAEPMKRDILLFLKGDVGKSRFPNYSRGLRQKIHRLSIDRKWRDQYRILVGTGNELPGDYTEQLARSVFCLVLPGDGWSSRAEDSILHGCIPVIIMDNVHAVFESILDYDAFSIRVKESAIENLPAILTSMPEDKILRMQRRLSRVWHRFAYTQTDVIRRAMESEKKLNHRKHPPAGSYTPDTYPLKRVDTFPVEDDAFNTIMKWLYSKIPETRGTATPQAQAPAR